MIDNEVILMEEDMVSSVVVGLGNILILSLLQLMIPTSVIGSVNALYLAKNISSRVLAFVSVVAPKVIVEVLKSPPIYPFPKASIVIAYPLAQ